MDFRYSWGQQWVYFHDDEGRLVTTRAAWTDLGPTDPFVEVSDGRSLFRVSDLLRLASLVGGLAG